MKPFPETHPLWAELRANPDDTLKLALADYLEENGDPATGYALRWCVAHDRWPRVTKSLMIWATDPSQRHSGKKKDVARSMLPLVFFVAAGEYERCDQLRGMSNGYALHTLADALGWLGEILTRLQRAASLERTVTATQPPR
ncbi:MAG TPA: hypothetical protein VGE74_15525 [Gemmata sp.]